MSSLWAAVPPIDPAVPAAPAALVETGLGEAVLFWVLAPLMVIAALGLLFVRKAVHAALLLASVMVCLAVLYFAQEAPFLGATQIFVYTGAVMMVFLFVLMLVGVNASESLVETLKGQKLAGVLAAAGLATLLISAVRRADLGDGVGLAEANAAGNPNAVAGVVFGQFVLPFELLGAILITAAVGAIVLTHRERLSPKITQRERAVARVASGEHIVPLPAPGVFARHNAVDTPALLPDGSPSELSVSSVLVARGQERDIAGYSGDVAQIAPQVGGAASREARRSLQHPAEADDAATPPGPGAAQQHRDVQKKDHERNGGDR